MVAENDANKLSITAK